jgi:DNA-directed RNA polymerase subunit RPC12/RpoP
MSDEKGKALKGKCARCNSPLELYEIDFEKGRRIMKCTECGLFHLYRRDFLGKWKLVRAGQTPDSLREPSK